MSKSLEFLSPVRIWLNDEPHHRLGIRVFQAFIGASILFRFFSEFSHIRYMIGVVPLSGTEGALGYFGTGWRPNAIWIIVGVSALGLLSGVLSRASTIALLASFTVWNRLIPEAADGGDNLVLVVLIYMIFLIPHNAHAPAGSVRVWFHNVAVVAIGMQICVLYLTAGLSKASGTPWTSGVAVYLIGQVEWVSLPSIRPLLKFPIVATLACYGTILHQVWFPIAIFSRLRFAWIAIGIAFHIGIAVFMGLVTFSLVLVGAELFFLTDLEFQRVIMVIRTTADSFRSRVAIGGYR